MIEVGHYGLHRGPGNIPFLLQGDDVQHLLPFQVDNPFKVVNRRACPHRITVGGALPGSVDLSHPLIQAMAPVPKRDNTVPYLAASGHREKEVVHRLGAMSAPVNSTILPVWAVTAQRIHDELQLTNVAPLVITDVSPRYQRLLDQVVRVAPYTPRTLVVLLDGPTIPRPNMRLVDLPTLPDLDYQAVGAAFLQEAMREDPS